MSNERIDLTKELEWLHRLVKINQVAELDKHDVIVDSGYIEGLIAELKRCYEKIDALTTALETIAGDLVCASSGDAIAKIAEYADEMSSLY